MSATPVVHANDLSSSMILRGEPAEHGSRYLLATNKKTAEKKTQKLLGAFFQISLAKA